MGNKIIYTILAIFSFLSIASIEYEYTIGEPPMYIGSDDSWITTTDRIEGWNTLDFDDSSWQNANVLGKPPVKPWREIINMEGTYAQWIDGGQAKDRYFRKIFNIDGQINSGTLKITADANYTLFVNGISVGKDSGEDSWKVAEIYDIGKYLTEGKNVIAVKASGMTLIEGLLVDAAIQIYKERRGINQPTTSETTKLPGLIVRKALDYNLINLSQKVNVAITIQNQGNSDIKDVEVIDRINNNFEIISGDFPNSKNPKNYDIIRTKESKEINYVIRAKEIGVFDLPPVNVTYIDNEGEKNIESESISVKVEVISQPPKPGVNLYGRSTEIYLGQDIPLTLSALNVIGRPVMHVQIILTPPSGMSISETEGGKGPVSQYTQTFDLKPGEGKEINLKIVANQLGSFVVSGRAIYSFGDSLKIEETNLVLPITVRQQVTDPSYPYPTQRIPGFTLLISLIGILLVIILNRYRYR